MVAGIPVLGVVAPSGTGKTTLLRKLLPLLRERGLRIGMVKHAHHSFEVDVPGKDSFELRKAGAEQMLIISRHRSALMTEIAPEREPSLADALEQLRPQGLDLVLVEGFKHESFPKIEVSRAATLRPALHTHDPSVIAIVTDSPPRDATPLPVLDLDDAEAVCRFILSWIGDQNRHAQVG